MNNKLLRITKSLKNEGLYGTYLKLNALISDPWFDIRYGIETSTNIELSNLSIKGANRKYGIRYQPTKVIFLRKLLKYIKPILPLSVVLVDLGSGKGRVLLVASEFGFREVRGIEFAHELCETARSNIAIYKSRKSTTTEFKVIEIDASQYPVQKDENVFFMFNPFEEKIMVQVFNNISMSLKEWPRKILIIYQNPIHDFYIKSLSGFTKVGEYNFGFPFIVYSNTL